MTHYVSNTHVSNPPLTHLVGRVIERLGAAFGGGIRTIQYARMMKALSEMSDENLRAIGLTRADVPRHAHFCVYGTYPEQADGMA